MTIEVTQQVNEIVVTAVADPTVRVVLEHVSTSAGGSGDGNVVGPTTPVIDGRPVVFDGTTGKRIKQGAINSPGGVLILNENGVAPETTIGANMVRHSELDDAIATHTAAPDPHGDRAYADSQVNALADATDTALSGKVGTSDPRLSDARTPTAHTHTATSLTTTELSTSKVLKPDGSGGVAWGTVSGGGGGSGPFTLKVPTGRYLSPAMQPYFNHPQVARVAFVGVAVGREQAWDGMGLVVKTAGSAATVDFGLYSDSDGYPGSFLASSVGVPISASNDKSCFGAFGGGSVTIPVGYYWMATLIHDPDDNCMLTVSDNSLARRSDANLYMSTLPPYSVNQTSEPGGYRWSSPAASLPATAPSGMWIGLYIPLPGLRAA